MRRTVWFSSCVRPLTHALHPLTRRDTSCGSGCRCRWAPPWATSLRARRHKLLGRRQQAGAPLHSRSATPTPPRRTGPRTTSLPHGVAVCARRRTGSPGRCTARRRRRPRLASLPRTATTSTLHPTQRQRRGAMWRGMWRPCAPPWTHWAGAMGAIKMRASAATTSLVTEGARRTAAAEARTQRRTVRARRPCCWRTTGCPRASTPPGRHRRATTTARTATRLTVAPQAQAGAAPSMPSLAAPSGGGGLRARPCVSSRSGIARPRPTSSALSRHGPCGVRKQSGDRARCVASLSPPSRAR